MPKYIVTKTLELEFECEADHPRTALAKCIDANDQGPEFSLVDCQYTVQVEDEKGEWVTVEDDEDDNVQQEEPE
jgi:hypothetical protein